MKSKKETRTQETIICVSGMTGCGKSTLAKRIAEKYGLTYLSGGNALKALAIEVGYEPDEVGWWETGEGMRFLRDRIRNSKFDKMVDQKLLELTKQGNVVLDSWTMPWLLKKGFKVWLEASPEVRAKRVSERDGIGSSEAFRVLKEKDAGTKQIFESLYGFDLGDDFSPFDLILDTNSLNSAEVFETVCQVADHLVFQNPQ